MSGKRGRRGWGNVRQLPSGRYQASYLHDGTRHTAPSTFRTKDGADGWLATQRAAILERRWQQPQPDVRETVSLTLRAYADSWLATRRNADGRDLSPNTRRNYRQRLNAHILPSLGSLPLEDITPAVVRGWYANVSTGPSQRAQCYVLLGAIMGTAYADELITGNPCRIRGGSAAPVAHDVVPATLAELEAITAATPQQYRLMVLLAAWCALRFGELAELRRSDVDVTESLVRVRRGHVRGEHGGHHVKDPKSKAGKRIVHIPPHLSAALEDHMRSLPAGPNGLLFAAPMGGQQYNPDRWWHDARKAAGRGDLHFHDLRHTGAVLAAATGATLAELMARLGHSTPGIALRYQHSSQERDRVIASKLSELATVTPIDAKRPAG